ncbi:hypothetical protein [Halpernia sp.]|uniref:hypothetical protein n=1 Tax=Halpernia sp. TaxID=2782209 RepID=UPI003A8E7AD9
MAKIKDTKSFMRITHRYLGFFMAGIMAMYAVSGILLIYRDTDFLKKEKNIEQNIAQNLSEKNLGKELKIKNFEILKINGNVVLFKNGSYNSNTGEVKYTKKELPFILKKMTGLHKAQSKNKLSVFNIFFGVSLFFFVVSSFWMFNVKSKAFKRGLIYTLGGFILGILLLYLS